MASIKAVAVSDTHGNKTSLRRIAENFQSVDYLFHLGDNVRDARYLERKMPATQVIFVRGNCDPGEEAADFEEVVLLGNRIILMHGHQLKVKYSYDRALYYAQERQAAAILFGHTHRAYCEYVEGIWLVNPGSAGERTWEEMTVCTLLIKKAGVIPKIVALDTPFVDF